MEKLKFLTMSISIIILLGTALSTAGCLQPTLDRFNNDDGNEETPRTGTIKVMYHSQSGNDAQIYLEDEFLGRISSDEWVTFEDIETGEYTIHATAIDDNELDSKIISVDEGETTRVELG